MLNFPGGKVGAHSAVPIVLVGAQLPCSQAPLFSSTYHINHIYQINKSDHINHMHQFAPQLPRPLVPALAPTLTTLTTSTTPTTWTAWTTPTTPATSATQATPATCSLLLEFYVDRHGQRCARPIVQRLALAPTIVFGGKQPAGCLIFFLIFYNACSGFERLPTQAQAGSWVRL